MTKITFLPVNKTCEAEKGESILDVALRNDIPIQHACGGFCACTTCQVIVKNGEENLSTPEENEEERMDDKGVLHPQARLGCQAKIGNGDVVVEVVNPD